MVVASQEEKEKLYAHYLDVLRQKLVQNYDALGLRASGKFEQELEPEIIGDKLIMWGPYHAKMMEEGRDPGKFPPLKAIEEWIEVKRGLPAIFVEKKKQFAFIIARKIAKQGIRVPNEFNKGKVISSVVDGFLANDIAEMIDKLGDMYLGRIVADVYEILQAA